MSDRICTNCGGASATGCFLCNPSIYPSPPHPLPEFNPWVACGKARDRVVMLESRVAELEARLKIDGQHPFPKDYDAIDLLNDRNAALNAKVAELEAENAGLKDTNKAMAEEIVNSIAVLERVRGLLEKWRAGSLFRGHLRNEPSVDELRCADELQAELDKTNERTNSQ